MLHLHWYFVLARNIKARIYFTLVGLLRNIFSGCSYISVFNIPPTGHMVTVLRLKVSADRLEKLGIKPGTPGYQVSHLSSTPRVLLNLT